MKENCLKPEFENFPKELTLKKQWAVFKVETDKDGKLTKRPYEVNTGKWAKSNDPQTWADFDAARQAYENGGYDGLVFVPTKNDKLVMWDFDDCWTDLGVIAKIAPFIQKLNSYTEISPGGKGLRVLTNSVDGLPSDGRKNGNIEVYDSGHFLSVTGHTIPYSPKKIKTRTSQIKKVHKQIWGIKHSADDKVQKILDRAYNSRQGEKIRRLFNCDYEHASQSEADLSLCIYLARHSNNDFVAIDKAFRQSKLMRKKWDTKHYSDGRTYGTATILKAIEANKKFIKEREATQSKVTKSEREGAKKKPRGRTLEELKQEYEYGKEIKFVWRNHLPKGMPVIIGGREGHGKTTNAIQIGKEIIEAHGTGMVIWLATEGQVLDTISKMEAMAVNERFVVAQRSDDSFKWEFSRDTDIKELDTLLEGFDETILTVFIDSIRGMCKFGDNDDTVGKVMHRINALVCDKHKASLVYIDHHKKGFASDKLDKNVGTTAKTAAVRIVYAVEKANKANVTIEATKVNLFSEIPPLTSIKQGNKIIISEQNTFNGPTLTDQAVIWLAELFEKNSEIPAKEISQAGIQHDPQFKEGTIKRAKKIIGCISTYKREDGSWIWKWEL